MWSKILVACLASQVFAAQADESEAVAAELRHHEHEHDMHHLPIAPGLNQQRKGILGYNPRPGYNQGYNTHPQGYTYQQYPPQYGPQYGYPSQYGYSSHLIPQNGYSSSYKPRIASTYPLLSRSSPIQRKVTFGKLFAGGLGLAAGAYLANKINSGYGYKKYRPGGYGYGYARPPGYYGYPRPGYGYRYRSLPSEEENLAEMADILARTESEIIDAQESRHHNMLNQQRGKLSNLLVGGLGVASGLYLANKYKRPSYGYRPSYGWSTGYPSYNTQREGVDTDIEQWLAELEERQAAGYGLYRPTVQSFYQDLPLYH